MARRKTPLLCNCLDLVKRNYYDGAAASARLCYDTNWTAQTFLTTLAYRLEVVKILVKRAGSPGTVTVSIRATAGGVPTGADLVSVTFDGDALTTDAGGELKSLSLQYDLANATTYAIVMRAPSGSGANYLGVLHNQANPLADAAFLQDNTSGTAGWVDGLANCDMGFQTWSYG